MIISLSTYGKQLLKPESTDEDIKRFYKDVILELVLLQYRNQLCENLIWYALQNL